MPMPKMNLVGQKFSRLTVIDYAPSNNKAQTRFKCLCDCGNEHIAMGTLLKRGAVKSCGCLLVETGRMIGLQSKVHGMLNTTTYRIWSNMKERCRNPSQRAYRWYGAKGVTVCERWLTFSNFLADMGERPHDKTLDRINPFGNYEPNNCRWADEATQKSNTRKQYLRSLCQP
jgi:hypothetical protein